jgi:group I intron endonuclease
MDVYRIYKCTNKINGKIYIGFTCKPLAKRIIEHKSSAKKGSEYLLHKAIRKYGIDYFKWECLYESFDRDFILFTMENHFIIENNSYFETGYGYNMTFGGQGGMLGKKHAEETKDKLKIARNKRIDKPMLGKIHSDESKQKMSLARLNNPNKTIQAQIAGKKSAEKRKNNHTYNIEQSKRMKDWWDSRKAIGK